MRAGAQSKPSPAKDLIAGLRLELGLTQNEVHQRSEGLVSLSVVGDVELGGNKMTSRVTFRGMAKGLGLTEEELEQLVAEAITIGALAARVLDREPDLKARKAS